MVSADLRPRTHLRDAYLCSQARKLYGWGSILFWLQMIIVGIVILIGIGGAFGSDYALGVAVELLPLMMLLFASAFLTRLALQSFSIVVESHYRQIMPPTAETPQGEAGTASPEPQ